jgi:hypothetical protein
VLWTIVVAICVHLGWRYYNQSIRYPQQATAEQIEGAVGVVGPHGERIKKSPRRPDMAETNAADAELSGTVAPV